MVKLSQNHPILSLVKYIVSKSITKWQFIGIYMFVVCQKKANRFLYCNSYLFATKHFSSYFPNLIKMIIISFDL